MLCFVQIFAILEIQVTCSNTAIQIVRTRLFWQHPIHVILHSRATIRLLHPVIFFTHFPEFTYGDTYSLLLSFYFFTYVRLKLGHYIDFLTVCIGRLYSLYILFGMVKETMCLVGLRVRAVDHSFFFWIISHSWPRY